MRKAFVSSLLVITLLAAASLPSSAKQIVVKLKAVGNSKERGLAILSDVPGKRSVRVTINVTGEPAGTVQPAHIYRGVCGSKGTDTYLLSSVVGSKSLTFIPGVTVAQLIAAHTYISVHKSPLMLQTIVSCGKIK